MTSQEGVVSSAASRNGLTGIPRYPTSEMQTYAAFIKVYNVFQAVHIAAAPAQKKKDITDPEAMWIQYLQDTFFRYPDIVSSTFSAENHAMKLRDPTSILGQSKEAQNLMKPCAKKIAWYASFIVQGHAESTQTLLSTVPVAVPAVLGTKSAGVNHTDPIWLFFGRNTQKSGGLPGRAEHTDSVSHSGTWHYQASGQKTWYIRPMMEEPGWNGKAPTLAQGYERLRVDVQEGDLFFLNTRLWWHATELPLQRTLSFSYARDFFLKEKAKEYKESQRSQRKMMSNVEGLYASKDVKRGEIVLTEVDLPDGANCMISDRANCMTTELPDGMGALVATKNIKAGDWLTVPPSSSDDEDHHTENKHKLNSVSKKRKKS